jgi:hypothetical protein
MKKLAIVMALFLGLAALPSLAHGGGAHLKGIVSEIASDRITVKDAEGHEAEATITRQTKFMHGKAAGKADDLHRGDRVVVHTHKDGDKLEAVEVHYGATKQP